MTANAASTRGRSMAAIGALTLSLTMAACGGGGGGGEQESPARPPAVEIDMVDLRFEPRALTIDRGETVTFRNRGKVTHNAKGKGFFSRVVEPGDTYRHRFDRAGTYEYVCTFHPGMEGTLTVN